MDELSGEEKTENSSSETLGAVAEETLRKSGISGLPRESGESPAPRKLAKRGHKLDTEQGNQELTSGEKTGEGSSSLRIAKEGIQRHRRE